MGNEKSSNQGVNSFLVISLIDDSPSPTNYNLKSEFNPTPGNKAYSFGIAREAYSKVYIKEHPPRDPSVPGPGAYTVPGVVGLETPQFTMRPKTVNHCI